MLTLPMPCDLDVTTVLGATCVARTQVDAETRKEILDVQNKLIGSKLDMQRRAEVVRFQCRIHDRLLSHPRSEPVATASRVVRSWAQTLPQVLWEVGRGQHGVSRAILRMLRTACQDIAAAPADHEAGARARPDLPEATSRWLSAIGSSVVLHVESKAPCLAWQCVVVFAVVP